MAWEDRFKTYAKAGKTKEYMIGRLNVLLSYNQVTQEEYNIILNFINNL